VIDLSAGVLHRRLACVSDLHHSRGRLCPHFD